MGNGSIDPDVIALHFFGSFFIYKFFYYYYFKYKKEKEKEKLKSLNDDWTFIPSFTLSTFENKCSGHFYAEFE